MKAYPKDIKFKYDWRKYQQRVLDELQNHLQDEHLHVVAPPGSGKTVLGLEVALRINKPTLILAPTIAIRNQWIQRFCELFLPDNLVPDWISRDIRNPKFMTVTTYQGLHAAINNLKIEEFELEEETSGDIENTFDKKKQANLDTISNKLKAQNVKTIVVDEAHHLKNEWWQSLTKIKEELQPVIVGLTATPPYDIPTIEWQRYIALNGPVDTEITVPELVMAGDLCPHQDYVYFTLPNESENHSIKTFRQHIENFFLDIRRDSTLIKAIENHPIWLYPNEHLDWIYNNLHYYSACLIYLNANNKNISKGHLEVIGDIKTTIPVLDYRWMETILDFYLFKERVHFRNYESHQNLLENKLRRIGAIDNHQISFSQNQELTGHLTASISKLDAINEIVDFEHAKLGRDLRLVILSDFIRKEFLSDTVENLFQLNKIGVIPIFEKLRRSNTSEKKIGVLSGSIVIIPKSACHAFVKKATEYGITQISYTPLPFDESYILVSQNEQLKHDIVNLVTQIFESGEIEILIGTKSLLGEGWDAPAINSLILASFVGSFVMSNQMRGRAVRSQLENPSKTANIWHLVCIDPTISGGGQDYDVLKRRFKSFVGISVEDEGGIENGIARLNLPETIGTEVAIEEINTQTLDYADSRDQLSSRWKIALETGINMTEEIQIPFRAEKDYKSTKSLYYNKTIANLVATLVWGLTFFGQGVLQGTARSLGRMRTLDDLYWLFTLIGILGVAIFGRLTFKTLHLYVRYRDIAKDIHQIGNALLNSLVKEGALHSDQSNLKIETSIDKFGGVYCHLDGGTTFEKSLFINSLQEIIAPVDNPKYVIIRKSIFMLVVKQRDYHSVPEILGRNKNLAGYFKNQWELMVGSCELVFTRSIEGRKLLLKSRLKALSSQFDNSVQRVNKWR